MFGREIDTMSKDIDLSYETYWNRATIRRIACFFLVLFLIHGSKNYWTPGRRPLEHLLTLKGKISSLRMWIILNNFITSGRIIRNNAIIQASVAECKYFISDNSTSPFLISFLLIEFRNHSDEVELFKLVLTLYLPMSTESTKLVSKWWKIDIS